jgi:glycosyltransferase involved in cell wall biosynthesis
MNILITSPSLDPTKNISGISTVVQSIIKYNKEHHYYHYLLGRADKKVNKLLWGIQLIKQFLVFPFFVKKNKIKMVHQNLPFDPKGVLREFVINYWCYILRVPVVLQLHGGAFIIEGTSNKIFIKLIQFLFRNSKQVIVLSEEEKILLKEKFAYDKSVVLPNCVDSSIFKCVEKTQNHNKPTLLYLGRIEQNKGIYELIEALKKLKNDFNFNFVLCGIGSLTDYGIDAFRNILGDDFEYKGVVSGESKIKIIKESDIFILPSYFEGMPMALLETMAAGVVPIVTNVGSMKQIIKHETNGLLIEKQNSNDLYEKLKYIILNPVHYQKISNNAQSTIRANYDIEKYIFKLNDIYSDV